MFESLFKAFSCIIRKEDEESVTWAEGSRHKAENVTDKVQYKIIFFQLVIIPQFRENTSLLTSMRP